MLREAANPEMTARQQRIRATGKLMKQIMHGIRARLDERLRTHGITHAQVRLLYEVRERPGSTGAQLARALAVSPQSAQTSVTRAVRNGWLRRGEDMENSRLVTLSLTSAGARLVGEADLLARELEAEIWAGISRVDAQVFTRVLERCLRNLEG